MFSPFLAFDGKWAIVLALTSNVGANDFQLLPIADESKTILYEKVMQTNMRWGTPDNLMFVVGATREDQFAHVRALAPDHFFLVPGVGAQGGDLGAISRIGMNNQCGLLVNSSRQIIYASAEKDFAMKARAAALLVQQEMAVLLLERKLI